MTKHEGEWEGDAVEEWKKLNAQVLLAKGLATARLEAVNSIGLFSVNHENLRLTPHAGNELLFVKLDDAPCV